jgi:hypothetical protein
MKIISTLFNSLILQGKIAEIEPFSLTQGLQHIDIKKGRAISDPAFGGQSA